MLIKSHFSVPKNRVLFHPLVGQFFIFCIIGTLNTVLDFFLYYVFTRLLDIYFIVANIISFALVSLMSFFLNKRWTFRDQNHRIHLQYMKFLTVVTLGLLLNTSLLYVFVRWLHISDLVAKAFAVGVVLFWNFGMNKLWTFSIASKSHNA